MGDDLNTTINVLNGMILMQGKMIEMAERLSVIENKITANQAKTVTKPKRVRINAQNFEITKEELHDLVNVKKIPFTTLAKRFGVSDYGVRKKCKTLGVAVRERSVKNGKELTISSDIV